MHIRIQARIGAPALLAAAFLAAHAPLSAATVWAFGAPGITNVSFTKANFADWTLPANQDPVSATVHITRQDTKGLYNALQDPATQRLSAGGATVAGTTWAMEGINGNPTGAVFGAANFAFLNFSNWGNAVDPTPPLLLDRKAVVHLIAEDTYFDIDFTSWTTGTDGGGFSYVRAVPVPEVSSAALFSLGLLLGLRRSRRR